MSMPPIRAPASWQGAGSRSRGPSAGANLVEGAGVSAGCAASSTNVDVRPGAEGWSDLAHALDLRAGIAVAEATLRGAAMRRCHNRIDHPALDPALQVNIYIDARMEPWTQPVTAPSDEIREWLELEVDARKLLE
jgi:succinate dehydrogenase / fumarate reductase flavoprotein subunit